MNTGRGFGAAEWGMDSQNCRRKDEQKPMETVNALKNRLLFRRGVPSDVDAIAGIYERIHDEEESGQRVIGWQRGIYPTRQTAQKAIALGDMFVAEIDGEIVAAGRINREQVDVYGAARWQYPAPDHQVMVLHTLVVAPKAEGQGIASEFVAFYERVALENGCTCLRIDTNEKNIRARALYQKLGFREADVIPCEFNGIPGVRLVCIEKKLK